MEDIEGMTKKAADLGATVQMQPFQVGDFGMMSVLQDPTGAHFALWKAKKGETTSPSGPGTICWTELMTEDVAKAGEFYSNLFGWTRSTMQMGSVEYTMFKNGETMAGGMMMLPAEAKEQGAPPHWLLYLSVNDCDKTVAHCKEMGGKACMEPTDFEGIGRGAVLTDPTGAVFGVIKLVKK